MCTVRHDGMLRIKHALFDFSEVEQLVYMDFVCFAIQGAL